MSEHGHEHSHLHSHPHDGDEEGGVKRRKLCSMGTGEVVHVLSFKAGPGKEQDFERIVQEVAHGLYHLSAGISDVRVCHPKCGEVCFIVTFLSRDDMEKFKSGPQEDALRALRDVVTNGAPTFSTSGTLMPDTHTLTSLVNFLKENVVGSSHDNHNIARVKSEMARWFPRREEYEKYIYWDEKDPTKYTRNLIFSNEWMDVLLMCWPPHSQSAIHSHDTSSCWVALVEGEVHEVQFSMPKLDKKFIDEQMKNPTGAVGRCTKLRVISETKLSVDGCSAAYANDDIGVHRVENRTSEPAYSLHVYAPSLRKMKIFKESGEVFVYTVAAIPYMSEYGSRTGLWGTNTHPDGILDISAWNTGQIGRSPGLHAQQTPSSGPPQTSV
mmetsp:Transcript_9644/g.23857  ORF Transcript_9644/g.23857 Transcript_9644/m.23857 type:complete len:382 (-) Transcript_9644:61-1206(-)